MNILLNVFGVDILFGCDTVYMGDISFERWNIKDEKLEQIP